MSDTSTEPEDPRIAEAERRAEMAERRAAFVQAGINIDREESPLGELLYQTWEGPADVAAIKQRAEALGYRNPGAGPASATEAAAMQLAQEQQLIRQGLSGGTPAGAAPTEYPDPWATAYEMYYDQLRRGIPADRARTEFGLEILGAAKRGDKRVFFNQEAHTARAKEIEALEGAFG